MKVVQLGAMLLCVLAGCKRPWAGNDVAVSDKPWDGRCLSVGRRVGEVCPNGFSMCYFVGNETECGHAEGYVCQKGTVQYFYEPRGSDCQTPKAPDSTVGVVSVTTGS